MSPRGSAASFDQFIQQSHEGNQSESSPDNNSEYNKDTVNIKLQQVLPRPNEAKSLPPQLHAPQGRRTSIKNEKEVKSEKSESSRSSNAYLDYCIKANSGIVFPSTGELSKEKETKKGHQFDAENTPMQTSIQHPKNEDSVLVERRGRKVIGSFDGADLSTLLKEISKGALVDFPDNFHGTKEEMSTRSENQKEKSLDAKVEPGTSSNKNKIAPNENNKLMFLSKEDEFSKLNSMPKTPNHELVSIEPRTSTTKQPFSTVPILTEKESYFSNDGQEDEEDNLGILGFLNKYEKQNSQTLLPQKSVQQPTNITKNDEKTSWLKPVSVPTVPISPAPQPRNFVQKNQKPILTEEFKQIDEYFKKHISKSKEKEKPNPKKHSKEIETANRISKSPKKQVATDLQKDPIMNLKQGHLQQFLAKNRF